jgi:hypothetical protein
VFSFSFTAEGEVFIRETLIWSALNASCCQRRLRDRLHSFRTCLVFFSHFRRFCDGDLKQTSFFHIPHHPFTLTSHFLLPLSLTGWILCSLPIAEFCVLFFRLRLFPVIIHLKYGSCRQSIGRRFKWTINFIP